MTLDYALPGLRKTHTIHGERRVARVLMIGTLLVYAYFFQGQGYNQNAQFDAIRAVVEHGTFEITPFARPGGPLTFTEDTYDIGGRIFSNKPPGMAIAGAPVYAVLAGVERLMGLNIDALGVVRFNAYALAMALSALPAAWVVIALFHHLLDRGVDLRDATLVAAGLAFGTLLLPYAGVLMAHNLLAACLFVPWVWVSRPIVSVARATAAGILVGLGVLTFLPVAPLAILYPIHLVCRRRVPAALAFCVGPALAVVVMLVYNACYYGSPFETGARLGREQFYEPHLFLGYFDTPDPRRLFWITLHPFRGLLYCCPVFILCLLSFFTPARAWLRANVISAVVIAFFILFYTSFNGWAGGFSVGPRYAIPALPFLMLFAVPAITHFRTIAIVLIVLSTLNMLAVTSYNVMVPGNSVGGPLSEDPVAECYKRLTMNWVARNDQSFNLAMLLEVRGVVSIIPAAIMIGGLYAGLWRLARESFPSASSRAGAP